MVAIVSDGWRLLGTLSIKTPVDHILTWVEQIYIPFRRYDVLYRPLPTHLFSLMAWLINPSPPPPPKKSLMWTSGRWILTTGYFDFRGFDRSCPPQVLWFTDTHTQVWRLQGRIQGGGGGAPGARPPKIGKNMIFWRKIVIFHTKYPTNFRASLRSAQFF